MPSITEIPDSYWQTFRSWNRQRYMEALLALNEEYQYNNYFISWDACLQVLETAFLQNASCFCMKKTRNRMRETKQSPAVRTLNWLISGPASLKQEDYAERHHQCGDSRLYRHFSGCLSSSVP